MSCVIGIVENGVTYFGYELQGIDPDRLFKAEWTQDKAFCINEYIIGYAGSYRIGQILQHCTNYPDIDDENLYKLMATKFIDALYCSLSDNGCIAFKDGIARMDDAELLVAVRGKLFNVQPSFSVIEPAGNYWCIGSAFDVALSSLYTTRDDVIGEYITPQERIKIAIAATSIHSIGVGSSAVVFSTDGKRIEYNNVFK